MSDTNFCWVALGEVPEPLLHDFDCGNPDFNEFLTERASAWQDSGETVTYLIVTEDDRDSGHYSRIYGYVSINATGLLHATDDSSSKYLSCAEIRMFAIAKQLRKRHDPTIPYSDLIFKLVLQNLYEMSVKTIGFKAIFLNANHEGIQLYRDNGFAPVKDFVPPTEEDKFDGRAFKANYGANASISYKD